MGKVNDVAEATPLLTEKSWRHKSESTRLRCSNYGIIIIIIIIIITLFLVDDFQMYKLKCENYNNLQYIYTYIKIHKS